VAGDERRGVAGRLGQTLQAVGKLPAAVPGSPQGFEQQVSHKQSELALRTEDKQPKLNHLPLKWQTPLTPDTSSAFSITDDMAICMHDLNQRPVNNRTSEKPDLPIVFNTQG